ncbi:hypothetical protein GCM10022280_25220 [Sphingomonas swuensis]|uniref:J domain-containing protein n=1 Tax=Sphingomonas swuensis TaxID=977800 RepID=A0ABP7TAJ8_9SPHN
MSDAYRVLGVLPTADDAVIRAAYLALMKRYHPDQPGADVERAKSVAAAYRLVSDPERRSAHGLAMDERFAPGGAMAMPRKAKRQTGRLAFFAISAATAGLLYAALTQPLPEFDGGSGPVRTAQRDVAKPAPEVPSVLPERSEPEPPVRTPLPSTEEPEAVLPDPRDIPLPTPAPLPLPLPAARDTAVRTPPAKPVELAQRRVATAPRKAESSRLAESQAQAQAQAQPPVRLASRQATRSAPTRGSDIDLAALDRHQVVYYNQSFLAGDQARRSRLMESRIGFLKRLEACGSDSCKRDAYLARNQEVAAIMRR